MGEEETGVDLELLERLRPFMGESIMVLDANWTVLANLAPPGGLIGRGLGVGEHTLEDMHPDDMVHILDLSTVAFGADLGWTGSVIVRMRRGDNTYGRYEITATNMLDDPVVHGMVVRTREVIHEDQVDTIRPVHTVVGTLAEILPVGIVILSTDGKPIFANDAARAIFGLTDEGIKASALAALVHADDAAPLRDAITTRAEVAGRSTLPVRVAQPATLDLECTLASVGDDTVTAVIAVLVDVTARRELERQLEHRANHDALTGLRNRAAVLDHLRDAVDAGLDLTVAYLDLDGFKPVNDRLGHAGGDRLLVSLADALRDHVGGDGMVARLGGDEFVIIYEGHRTTDALADGLHAAIAATPGTGGVELTCSIGFACSQPGDTPRDLLHRADEAMFGDKRRRAGAAH